MHSAGAVPNSKTFRLLLLLIVISLLPLLPQQWSKTALIVGFLSALAIPLGRHIAKLIPEVIEPALARWQRVHGVFLLIYGPKPEVDILIASSLLVAIIGSGAMLLTADRDYATPMLLLAGVGLILAGATEVVQRLRRVFTLTWSKPVGKACWLAMVTFSSIVAVAVARNYAFALLSWNPSLFPGFVSALTIVLTPVVFTALVGVVLVAMAFIEIVVAGIFHLIFRPMSEIRGSRVLDESTGSPRAGEDKSVLAGASMRQSAGYKYPFVRAFSLLVVAFSLYFLSISALSWRTPLVDQALAHAAVALDFLPCGRCECTKENLGIVRLDREHVLAADWDPTSSKITTHALICEEYSTQIVRQ